MTQSSWAELYSQSALKKWGLQANSSLDKQGQARGLALRWSQLNKSFQQLMPDPIDNIWYVVCDVLILDEDLLIEDNLYIFARQIELQEERRITIEGASSNCVIVTNRILRNTESASLEVMIFEDEESEPRSENLAVVLNTIVTVFSVTATEGVTIQSWKPDNSVARQFVDGLQEGELLRLGLVTAFQVATLLSSTEPTLAIAQFQWVAAIAGLSSESHQLSQQALSQMGWVVQTQQDLVVVPPLDFEVYSTSAKSRVDVLKARDEEYQKWIEIDRDNEQWLEYAKLNIDKEEAEAKLASQLFQRTMLALNKAKIAKTEAQKQVNALKLALEKAKSILDTGVKNWAIDQRQAASVKLVKSIVTLGVEVGEVAALPASPAAATSAAKVIASAKQAKAAGGVANELDSVVGNVQQLVKLEKMTGQLQDMSENTLNQVEKGLDSTISSSGLEGLNVVTGGSQIWKSLETSMNDVFAMNENLLNQIEGGPGFRVAFRQLILGAEAYCSARLAIAEATNDLVQAKLRAQTIKKILETTKRYERKLIENDTFYQQIQQQAFARLLDDKLTAFLEVEKYHRALRYFTLADRLPEPPKISASLREFEEEASVVSGYELALSYLNPAPQPMQGKEISFNMTEKKIENYGDLIVQIDVDHPEFKGCSRVRIDELELDLIDVNDQKVLIDIDVSTSGTYYDITPDGNIKKFVGDPWQRAILYERSGVLYTGAATYARYGDKLFKPTPFTTWTITPRNKDSLSQISTVTFKFSGEVSPMLVSA